MGQFTVTFFPETLGQMSDFYKFIGLYFYLATSVTISFRGLRCVIVTDEKEDAEKFKAEADRLGIQYSVKFEDYSQAV